METAAILGTRTVAAQFDLPVIDLGEAVLDPNPDHPPTSNPEIPVGPIREIDTPVSFTGSIDHTIKGGNASEIITGHDDNFLGFGGNDHIDAGGGNDTVYGKEGHDMIRGGAGNDRLYGGSGNDQIAGGADNDYISGGPGNDRLFGESGNDTLWGGIGNDLLSGGTGHDLLRGSEGDDKLFGGFGNDWLEGGTGKDVLSGGIGADVMNGGAGADRFVFESVNDSLNLYGRSDTIQDFQKGVDKLDFSQIDANENVAGDQRFSYVNYGGPNQVLGAGQMTAHFDETTGKTIIEANVDGDRSNEFHLELDGNVVPNISDLIL